MAEQVNLHGGPRHGESYVLADGSWNLIVIRAANTKALLERKAGDLVPAKRGSYSRVRNTSDFEWDGWRE